MNPRGGGQAGGGESHHSNEVGFLILALLLGGMGYMFWSRIGGQVESVSIAVARWFLFPFLWVPDTKILQVFDVLPRFSANPSRLSIPTTLEIWSYVCRFWSAVLIPVMGWMFFDLYKREKIVRKFRRTHGMESLLEDMSKIFPTQQAALKSRYWEKDSVSGRWSSPVHPYIWAVGKKCIRDLDADGHIDLKSLRIENGFPLKPSSYDPRRYALDRDNALMAFSGQLDLVPSPSPRRDLVSYPFPVRLLVCVFMMKGVGGKGDESMALLDKAATLFEVRKNEPVLPAFDEEKINKAIGELAKHPDVKNVLDTHAFMVPTMIGLLQFARRKGVLVSPNFIWLRPMHTVLWRALNQVGNTVAWIESAGAMAHFQAEEALAIVRGKPSPIFEPKVEEAVRGLELFLMDENENWISDPSRNKRG